jgi:hypothetical protein
MDKLKEVVQSLLCVFIIVCSATAFAGQNVLYYSSEPGDYIGQGAEATYTGTDGTFSVSPNYANGAYVTFIAPGYAHWWYLNLAAAGNVLLQPGAYENAQRWPFQAAGHPGLDFSGDGRGCNTLTGRFDVLEIVRDSAGTITRLAANWEQHCEGGQPALYGQIRYNSDVPLSRKSAHITLENPLNTRGCVEASNPKGALLSLNANDATDANGGKSLLINWTSTTGDNGTGPMFSFTAPLTTDLAKPVVINLTVTDLTNNSQKSATKSVCVSDTTPPGIVINSPTPGQVVRGDNLILDVSIKDTVDNNITQYEVYVGSNFVSPINPLTGRSRQQILEAPKVDGTISTTITVRARDASGNSGQQSVSFSQISTSR